MRQFRIARFPSSTLALTAALALCVGGVALPAAADVAPGEEAPAFTLTAADGAEVSLADYRGKYVVLEWLNRGCPFVGKQYRSGNMQALQRTYTAKGVMWLSIISSAPGKQGYCTPAEATAWASEQKAAPTHTLLDPAGDVGRLYGAKTTPHMFVIDPEGTLIYQGAIDDKRSTRVADVETAHNYVVAALDAAMAGQPVSVASTTPYGCSVKY